MEKVGFSNLSFKRTIDKYFGRKSIAEMMPQRLELAED
jgi:hypothetical protein